MRHVLATFFAICIVLWPVVLVHAGGAINPPPPGSEIGRVEFRASIMLDPHNAAGDVIGTVPILDSVTTTAKQASIQLRDAKKGTLLSQASFQALPDKPFSLGCDTSLSTGRFVYTTQNGALLAQWVPPAALQHLFGPLGISAGPTNEPAILEILSQQCVSDPRNPGPLSDSTTPTGSLNAPGLLLMDVVIRFQIFP